MSDITALLEEIRDYEIEKYDTMQEFREDLERLIAEKYSGDISTFMKEEILNEDYGSLRYVVTKLLEDEF